MAGPAPLTIPPVGFRFAGDRQWEIEELDTLDRYLVNVEPVLDPALDVGDEFDIEGHRYRLVRKVGSYLQGIYTVHEEKEAT